MMLRRRVRTIVTQTRSEQVQNVWHTVERPAEIADTGGTMSYLPTLMRRCQLDLHKQTVVKRGLIQILPESSSDAS